MFTYQADESIAKILYSYYGRNATDKKLTDLPIDTIKYKHNPECNPNCKSLVPIRFMYAQHRFDSNLARATANIYI